MHRESGSLETASTAIQSQDLGFYGLSSGWKAADQQTLRDHGITSVVTDADHPADQTHNPNTP